MFLKFFVIETYPLRIEPWFSLTDDEFVLEGDAIIVDELLPILATVYRTRLEREIKPWL